MASRRTEFADGGLIALGTNVPYFAGGLQYWRTPPAEWPAKLRALRDLGLTLVDSYVPWRLHESAVGTFDWTGGRDVARFTTAARAAGLGVVLRLGPASLDELPCFGFPDHVLADPAVRSGRWFPSPPRAWPIPSYASAAFQAHVRRWFAALAKVVTPDAIVLDGAGPGFYRDAASERVDPSGLAEIAALLDEVGFADIARRHVAPPVAFDRIAIAGAGMSAYSARDELGELVRRARATSGKASPIPLALDVRATQHPFLPPRDVAPRDQLLALFAGGIRGFSIHGDAADLAFLAKLMPAISELPALRRCPAVAVVDLRAELHRATLLDPIAPILADALGLDLVADEGERVARQWRDLVLAALERAQLDYDLVDEAASEDRLGDYRVVIAPARERIAQATWDHLRAIAAAGRAVVVIGPEAPTLDAHGAPLQGAPRRMGRINAAMLVETALAELAESFAELVEPSEWHVERAPGIQLTPLVDGTGTTRVVIAVNTTAKAATPSITAHGASLRDPLTGETFAITAGRSSFTVAAYGARLLLVAN